MVIVIMMTMVTKMEKVIMGVALVFLKLYMNAKKKMYKFEKL
jgi:hypothetical protein